MKSAIKKTAEKLFVLPDDDPTRGYLVGGRCRRCHTVSFPPRPVCPHCLGQDTVVEVPLGKEGVLFSFSVNRMAPEGFEAPYVTGKVDLAEGVRVFGVITGCEPREDALRIGMKMETVFEPVRRNATGDELVGYAFRPAPEDEATGRAS